MFIAQSSKKYAILLPCTVDGNERLKTPKKYLYKMALFDFPSNASSS